MHRLDPVYPDLGTHVFDVGGHPGEQTATANRGMEGAMESGERAALEVLDYL